MDERKDAKNAEKETGKEDEPRMLSLDELDGVAGGRGGGRHDPPT